MKTLEAKGYIASDDDVKKLTTAIFDGDAQAESGRSTYLKTLVASTQAELGAKPRARASSKAPRLDDETVAAQLSALAVVHERFYTLIADMADKAVPKGAKDRGIEVNRKTNFARTALYAVRGWIRDKRDITAVAAKTVTKLSLAVEAATPKPASPKVLKVRAERESKALMVTLMALADGDKAAAVVELNLLMDQVTAQLLALSSSPVGNAAQAAREHRPLKIKRTVFMPTQTQIVAQQERPS